MTSLILEDLKRLSSLGRGKLRAKLELFGFWVNALAWIRSYLTDILQSVYMWGDTLPIDFMVVKGSMLGPILCLIASYT